jgi:3-oxoacyl-[acyl-carrier-protein] synthase II
MRVAMEIALRDQQTEPGSVGYVSAHGTATDRGDIAESHATAMMFSHPPPLSSLKSYTGHTLGACGALEAWVSIKMMREGWFHPTLNLTEVDPECADLDYIMAQPRKIECDTVMSNNFAFGGINTSLIFRSV